jgi:DNA-directed RNA polymerase subunit RPC12/RpoP
MALRFRCEKCGKRLTVNESPGARVTCPHCNQTIVVPADAQAADGGAPDAVPVAAPAAESPPPADQPPEEAAEEEAGMGTVMSWLALYLPSWGSSVVLHAAVFVLAAFLAWQQAKPQDPFKYTTGVVAESKPKVVKRAQRNDQESSRGKMRPQPSSIVRQFTTNPFPDVASNKLEEAEVFGVGAGGNQIGGFEGLGDGSGRGSGSGFFGTAAEEASKIVYVVDRSGSMTDSIVFVKYELKRSIRELGPEKQFHVVFYSSGPALEMPARRLVSATDANKQKAFEFIDSVIPQGETDPSDALSRAFAVNPELIYLLTDGEFDKAIVGQVAKANAGKKVTVHTIGFLYKMGEKILKDIAAQNNGTYKFVAESDLETLLQ